MFIPLKTDAPVYHWPFATLGLMIVNIFVAVYVLVSVPKETSELFLLAYGDGYHPMQWLSSVFIQKDIMRLLGDTVFLWIMGLVIEGKVGWWKFLLIYFGIGIMDSALEQTVALHFSPGFSGGASAIVYGLIGMALIWAPKNEVTCVWIFFRVSTFEINIMRLSTLYLALELVFGMLEYMAIGSSMLHLLGAFLGLGLGTFMLKQKWVDCEYWDIFAVLDKRAGKLSKPEQDKVAANEKFEEADLLQSQHTSLNQFIEDRNGLAAYNLLSEIQRRQNFVLDDEQFDVLSGLLLSGNHWEELVYYLEGSLKKKPSKHNQISLLLVQVLLEEQKRPQRALYILNRVKTEILSENQNLNYQALLKKAKELSGQDILELE